jgi:hypothetical protein
MYVEIISKGTNNYWHKITLKPIESDSIKCMEKSFPKEQTTIGTK